MSIKKGILLDLVMVAIIGLIGFIYITFFAPKPQQISKTILPPNATITDLAKPQTKTK